MRKQVCTHCGHETINDYAGMICTECHTGHLEEKFVTTAAARPNASRRGWLRFNPVWLGVAALLSVICLLSLEAVRRPLSDAREVLAMLGLGLLGLMVYLIPAVIAHRRQHRNAEAITILTVFAGWTGIGWIVALVWAYTNPAR